MFCLPSTFGIEYDRFLSIEVASYPHHYHKTAQRRQRSPEAGDLVLVRNHKIDNQNGRKFGVRWLGPRLLVKCTKHRQSGWVREIHGHGGNGSYPRITLQRRANEKRVSLRALPKSFVFLLSPLILLSFLFKARSTLALAYKLVF